MEEYIPKTYLRKCLYCQGNIDIRKEKIKKGNRYVHEKCLQFRTRDEEYIDKIYEVLKKAGIKYNYFLCEAQRKKYISENGYTNEGICRALTYFYEKKSGAVNKSYVSIGIVPYVYAEAENYYYKDKTLKKEIAKSIRYQNDKVVKEVSVLNYKNPKSKNYIDLDNIEEGEN